MTRDRAVAWAWLATALALMVSGAATDQPLMILAAMTGAVGFGIGISTR
jgi:hypothetical protein